MAKRAFGCPSCAAPVEVPAGFTHAVFMCPVCNASLDVRTGAMLAPPPPPPVLQPSREPSNWHKWAILGGSSVAVAVIVLAVVLIRNANQERALAPLNAQWETYDSPDGWFRVQMPGAPGVGPGPAGGRAARATVGDAQFWVSYHDLGVGPADQFSVNFRSLAEAHATTIEARVEELSRRDLIGYEGRQARMIGFDEDQLSWMLILRRGNRVYQLGAENLRAPAAAAAEQFMASLEFKPVVYPSTAGALPTPTEMRPAQQPPTHFQFFEDQEDTRRATFSGGTPPYRISLHNVRLPRGLKAETSRGEAVSVTGSSSEPGDYEFGYTVVDAAGFELTDRIVVRVEANPFSIVMSPETEIPGKVLFQLGSRLELVFDVDGPTETLQDSGVWEIPWLPFGFSQELRIDRPVITATPSAGTDARIEVRWVGTGKDKREYKCSFTIHVAEERRLQIAFEPEHLNGSVIEVAPAQEFRLKLSIIGELALLAEAGAWTTPDLPREITRTLEDGQLVLKGTPRPGSTSVVKLAWTAKRKNGDVFRLEHEFELRCPLPFRIAFDPPLNKDNTFRWQLGTDVSYRLVLEGDTSGVQGPGEWLLSKMPPGVRMTQDFRRGTDMLMVGKPNTRGITEDTLTWSGSLADGTRVSLTLPLKFVVE